MSHTKVCIKCIVEKPLTEYTKNKRNKDNLDNICRDCLKKKYYENRETQLEAQRKWREANPNYQREWAKDNQVWIDYLRNYYKENREKYITRKQEWRKNNPEAAYEEGKNYKENNKEKINAWAKNEQNKFHSNMRQQIYAYLRNGKDKQTPEYLGCTFQFLKDYIASMFNDNMTWDNHGAIWEIDHIIPCFAWDITNDFECFCCWNYRNLQPLSCADNRRKACKYEESDKIAYMEMCKTLYTKLDKNT
jgi:hypothetical protein